MFLVDGKIRNKKSTRTENEIEKDYLCVWGWNEDRCWWHANEAQNWIHFTEMTLHFLYLGSGLIYMLSELLIYIHFQFFCYNYEKKKYIYISFCCYVSNLLINRNFPCRNAKVREIFHFPLWYPLLNTLSDSVQSWSDFIN